jgi:hypothetical protein
MRVTTDRDGTALRAGHGTRAVATLVGCHYAKLMRWVSAGLIGGEPFAAGTGSIVVLDDSDLEEAWVCARLSELGVKAMLMHRALEDFRRHERPQTGDVLVVFPPEGSATVRRRTDVHPPDPAWVVPLQTAAEILNPDEGWITVTRDPNPTPEPGDEQFGTADSRA